MNEDEITFIDRTIKHIRRVQDNMILLAKNFDKLDFKFDKQHPDIKFEKWDLIRRCMRHDSSKFSKELIYDYIKTNTYYRCKRLNIPCEIKEEELESCWKAHIHTEYHHPEKYIESIWEMTNLDICEMCCDLAAMSQEFGEEDYTQYFIEKLSKEVPLVTKYEKDCIKILTLLQELNN